MVEEGAEEGLEEEVAEDSGVVEEMLYRPAKLLQNLWICHTAISSSPSTRRLSSPDFTMWFVFSPCSVTLSRL